MLLPDLLVFLAVGAVLCLVFGAGAWLCDYLDARYDPKR